MNLDKPTLEKMAEKALYLTQRAAWLEEKQREIIGVLKASTVGMNADELKAQKSITDLVNLLQKKPNKYSPHLLFGDMQITLVHIRKDIGETKITE